MLHRYWFILNSDMPYGPANIGVSSYSINSARELVKQHWQLIPALSGPDQIESIDYVEDIDLRNLDVRHVIPNIGIVVNPGVWWPNLSNIA